MNEYYLCNARGKRSVVCDLAPFAQDERRGWQLVSFFGIRFWLKHVGRLAQVLHALLTPRLAMGELLSQPDLRQQLGEILQEELRHFMGQVTAELRALHATELSKFSAQLVDAVALLKQPPKRKFHSMPLARHTAKAVPEPAAATASTCLELEMAREIPVGRCESCLPSPSLLPFVTHELKSPLNGLAGYARTLAETDTARQKEFRLLSQAAQGALDSATNLTDLWNYARQEVGDLVRNPVSLEDLNRMTREQLERSMNSKGKPLLEGVALTMEVEGSLAMEGDLVALSCLQYHLLFNAVKFTPGGEVALAWRPAEGAVCLTVKDTGIGMANAEPMFEAFVVEDASAARKIKGIGLGLAVVREIARLHSAQIRVASAKSAGCTVQVRFPA